MVTIGTLNPLDTWYIGGITDETAREFSVKLDFLTPGKTYEAIIYADGNDASGLPDDNYNPYSYTITKEKVTSKTVLKLRMAPCG
ncbi:MAG: glycoside hydrolase family 97 C-terminal domain-containing protein, partial [Bacteroidales bacterium]|nr:glycoside hydrolase family 97 C-terminal domain-containing protein [Bacteroidales bacterium]